MTREEAISVLENPDVSIGIAARIGQDPEYWKKLKPALDMAISALRQQETVIKCNDLFDEDGGDIYPENDSICSSTNLPCCRCNPGPCDHRLEPVTERHELNEPLTLDELRKMYDGEDGAVWVRFGNSRRCWPAILDTYDGELVAVWSASLDFCHEKDYGKTWLAYRQKPEEGTV